MHTQQDDEHIHREKALKIGLREEEERASGLRLEARGIHDRARHRRSLDWKLSWF